MSREQTSSLPKDLTSGEYCPACRSALVNDREKGENVCPECGYVAPEPSVETSIGWKYSNDDHTRVSERSGIPSTFSLHDYGLSTDISTVGRDSHGKSLDNYSRETAERMQMWQRRIRTSASGEKSLSNALTKISEVSGQLKLPTSLIEDASLIFRKSSKQNVSKSKSIAGMAAASVYLACRHGNVNRSLSEIASAAGIQPRAAARYYRLLLNEVERNYVAPLTVQK